MKDRKARACLTAILLFSLSCSFSASCSAENDSPGDTQLRPAIKPISPSEPASDLNLDKFLRIVEKNYPKLISADFERRIASAKRLEKAGAFDPTITHLSEYLRVQDTFTPGKAKDAVHNEGKLDLLTRSGIKIFAGARLNPNDTKTPFVPTGRGGEYVAGVTVPLMRGFKINEKSAAEEIAKIGEPLAAQLYGASRLEVLLKAAAVYFDWCGAKARILVAKDLLGLAQVRVDQIKKRVEKGDSPALEITESEQEIQRRQATLVKTEREFQKAAIALSVFFWDEFGNPSTLPDLSSVPALDPRPRLYGENERTEGKRLAVENRPELKKINLEREQIKIELRLAQNLMLPVMDAYVVQGADTGLQGIGPIVRGGLAVSLPLRQRTARGLREAALLKIEKLNQDEKAEKQRIYAEVDDTISAINAAYNKYTYTGIELQKAKEVESGERKRYFAGDSTLFLVNQRERTTAEANMRLLEAHVEYLQALAAFRVVTCRI